ncbi:hypothetical protein NIES3974_03160 [Calothrix sp. NIES-3974]|nr:hypothetical protein NIES3974_03160 [Calothrix sp. NIES-3974]
MIIEIATQVRKLRPYGRSATGRSAMTKTPILIFDYGGGLSVCFFYNMARAYFKPCRRL